MPDETVDLDYYRRPAYASYRSSAEILRAVEEEAGGRLPPDEPMPPGKRPNGRPRTWSVRVWSEPTVAEAIRIKARAWQLAPDDCLELRWGRQHVYRSRDAIPSAT